jgi:prepilin-type processing-associated H-X9-DG protein
MDLGVAPIGSQVTAAYTAGPVLISTMNPPTFSKNETYSGANGWWATWHNLTLQDYRLFAPVHRNMCNIAFADGSVRAFSDLNYDGQLNNGFPATSSGAPNGFADDTIEIFAADVFSAWTTQNP